LHNYKYSGKDLGIAYIHFYDPVASYLVTLIPEWIAPNTLTFIGFLFTVMPICLLYMCIGAALIGESPSWFILLQGVSYFIYRMLDEMDGK